MKSEFIFEKAPFASCHASTICETGAGLIAAWFGGTRESANDVGIWTARYEGGGWRAPVEVATGLEGEERRFACWNPVLFQPENGPLILFYKVGPSPRDWWGKVKTSADGGVSWSQAQQLPDGILGPIKNKPVQLSDGTILSPSSTEHPAEGWNIHFERSEDGGKTWTKTPVVRSSPRIDAIQPSLLLHENSALQAIGRTRSGKIFEAWSQDEGWTWGEMTLTGLPNPNSGTDGVTLADSTHLLVYNHSTRERYPLNVAVSDRDGKNWQEVLILEQEPGEYSYPAVIQSRDGRIHITYTWNRLRIKHVVLELANSTFKQGGC